MSLCVVLDRTTEHQVGLSLYGSVEKARAAYPSRDRYKVVVIDQICEATEECWDEATTAAVDPDIDLNDVDNDYADQVVPICGRCRPVDEHGVLEGVASDV